MTLRHGQCRFGASAGLGGAFGIAGFAGALSRGFNLATGPGVGGGAAGAEEPTFTARPNSRHLPATGARRSKLTCTGADREKSGHPHDVVLDPRRHRQLRIEHKRARKIEIVIALPGENLAEPRGRVHRLETGRAEIAQNCIIVCLVGLIEREQGRTDEDENAVAIDLRRLGRRGALLRRLALLRRRRLPRIDRTRRCVLAVQPRMVAPAPERLSRRAGCAAPPVYPYCTR